MEEKNASRYVVGIDLGTTNSAVCFVDTEETPWQVRVFAVPQLVAPQQVEARETLPSFHYQSASGEFSDDALKMPWDEELPEHAVGIFARDQGMLVPGRLVASAKSWLCHPGVDRTADLLPWHGAADVERLSPVEAASRYLAHIRLAWDHQHPKTKLAEQDLVITLPASFDEVARELTVKAAQKAGLQRVVLIEEPQAAFYAWINRHAEDWENYVKPGQKILVCDIGGGTSDFTLIKVRSSQSDDESGSEGKKVQFHRVAVGDHLILGGDNLDLALAHHLEKKLMGEDGKLQTRQWDMLVRSCRQVKETLLGEHPPANYTINIAGSGSGLIGGSLRVEISREEATEVLVEGFLPTVSLEDKPAPQSSGFKEFGLPYASDAAITKYLAQFLTDHRNVRLEGEEVPTDHDPARPDIVLFNGGLFASPILRERLLGNLQQWFRTETDPDWSPLVLDNDQLYLAVARGAAYYGMVRRGVGVKIAAGLARTYYIGVGQEGSSTEESSTPQAVCLVPAGVEPGQEIDLTQRTFDLLVSEPVEFPLYVSSTRLTDHAGSLVTVDREKMSALPPIRTVLKSSKKTESVTVPVNLHARLTEIGTLDLWCGEVAGNRRWRLQFDVRSTTQTDMTAYESAAEGEGIFDESSWADGKELIFNTFGKKATEKPGGFGRRLGKTLNMSRKDWPTSLLREIWDVLMQVEEGRRKSANHEGAWLNLLGFSLRPGYGLAMDDWRVNETWSTLRGKLVHGTPQCRAEWWILWRRIAGGIPAGQQLALAAPLLGSIRQTHKQMTTGKGKGGGLSLDSQEAAELWRFLGSLELLPVRIKIELGEMLLDFLPRKKLENVQSPMLWALGRIGAREPLYGPLNAVLPADVVHKWLRKLFELEPAQDVLPLTLMQLARRTDDRYRDLLIADRERVQGWLEVNDAPPHFVQLVAEGGRIDSDEAGMIFGESLPTGLRLN